MVKSKLLKGISCVLVLCTMLCSSVVSGFALDDANSVSEEVDLGFAITKIDYTLVTLKKIGDVSDDGIVNLKDAILLQKAVLDDNLVAEWKSKGIFAAADLNRDGKIAMREAITVMKVASDKDLDLGTYYPEIKANRVACIDSKGFLHILKNKDTDVYSPYDGYDYDHYKLPPLDGFDYITPDLYIVKGDKAYITCTTYNGNTYIHVCSSFVIAKDIEAFDILITENGYCYYPENVHYILESPTSVYVLKGSKPSKVPPTGIII